MKNGFYSIYDRKIGYTDPFPMQNDDAARRAFSMQCRRPESPFRAFPADYELVKVGEFDTETGIITAYSEPHYICNPGDCDQEDA